jgi:hypothetical protein
MAPIPHLSYIVFQDESHWTVGFGQGDGCGRYPSRRTALKSALQDAVRVRGLGCDVDVWVRRKDGTLRRIRDQISIGDPVSSA